MISVQVKGSFSNTVAALTRMQKLDITQILDRYGAQGVAALSQATPKDTSETALEWSYRITRSKSRIKIAWFNAHADGETPVAILIQYGHATRGGGYVQGRDFINPVMRPIFDNMASDVWKEVNR